MDPARIPQRRLYTGARMPAVGLGTFGSDHVSPSQVAEAVKGAAEVGYRHFDCASVYGNEAEIGASFEAILEGGVKREELWITSKLWNDMHGEEDVIASCRRSLKDLRLDYLNLATDPGRRTRFATAGRGVLVAAVLRPLPLTAPPETSPGRQRSVFLTKNSRFSSIPPKPGHTSRLRMTIPKRLRCILRSQI